MEKSASIGELRRVLRETGSRILVVANDEGRLEGVIYRSSVILVTSRKSEAKAQDIMDEPPVVLKPHDLLEEAVFSMLKYDEWYSPVVNDAYRILGLLGLEIPIRLLLDAGFYQGYTVRDVMTRDVDYVLDGDSLTRVWEIMVEKRYAGVPVVDKQMVLKGIVTQYDLIKKGYTRLGLESETPPHRVRVESVMTRSVIYAAETDPLEDVARIMLEQGIGRVPVVKSRDSRILTGIVDREDLVRLYFKSRGRA
ncbi:CBS domain-containing protein [Aeropyrum camini]|uniref:CBS domain-containing protein n=1 Tax=Aeropyrum camini TaxID=229980 RepID=UPI00210AE407|nr:CBS domain-containing protein [Aeropyrum camini]